MPKARAGKRFPLWLHAGVGQWAKKIRGRHRYFGTDREKALERYERERKYLEAGREPPAFDGGLTVREAVNHFLTARRSRVDSGELTAATWGEYFHAAEQIVETLGRETPVAELRPEDFARLRADAAKRLGPVALGKFVTLTRTTFKHAYDADLIPTPVKFGLGFDKPPKRVVRLDRHGKGAKLIEPADARKLLDRADPQMRAMILLGLNCGFGQTDCANLSRKALDRPGWLAAPRTKTGTPRRCPLWPETVAALEAVAKVRPDPADPADADMVFLTQRGNRWVRFKDKGDGRRGVWLDAVASAYSKLAKAAGVELAGGFYVLRHTFRTVADATKDQPACMLIMGHADATISGHYREDVSDERLTAVTDHVRKWLGFGGPKPRRTKGG